MRGKNNKRYAIILACVAVVGLLAWRWRDVNDLFLPPRIKHIALMNLPGNRLRFNVIIDCSKPCKTFVKYWKQQSKDTFYTNVTTASRNDTAHILNTEADTDYGFQVVAFNGSTTYTSKVHDFKTQFIYHATPYFDLEYVDSSYASEIKGQYFLTQILTEPGSLVIINSKGNIVWYEPFQKGVKVSHWTSHQTMLCIAGSEKIPSSGGDEIFEMDLNGNVLRHLQTGKCSMDEMVHHEVRTDADRNLYALTFTTKRSDLSSVGGTPGDTIHGDGIVIFNAKNEKIWHWSSLDHLDALHEPDILKKKKDWGHANALFRDVDGNFLISFRDFSQIWKVHYPDGKVLWKLGEGGDFSIPEDQRFNGQHAIHFNAAGQLVMLDNGTKRKQSRAMIMDLDTVHKTATAALITPVPKEYFSATKGNAAVIRNNRMLFCLTDPRVFLVTDQQGKILWKVNLAGDPYRLEAATGFLTSKPVAHE